MNILVEMESFTNYVMLTKFESIISWWIQFHITKYAFHLTPHTLLITSRTVGGAGYNAAGFRLARSV